MTRIAAQNGRRNPFFSALRAALFFGSDVVLDTIDETFLSFMPVIGGQPLQKM